MVLMAAPPLPMSVEEREALVVMSRSLSLPRRQVVQAKELLLAAEGVGQF